MTDETTYNKATTIRVMESTKDRLSSYGVHGETFDHLITRILDKLDEDRRGHELGRD